MRTPKTYQQIMHDLREDHDITQQQIASYLHITQAMYSRYERGAAALPTEYLIALCRYYGVSADYFLGLSKEK